MTLLELPRFPPFRPGTRSARALKPERMRFRRRCSEMMWFVRFWSSVRRSRPPRRLLEGDFRRAFERGVGLGEDGFGEVLFFGGWVGGGEGFVVGGWVGVDGFDGGATFIVGLE